MWLSLVLLLTGVSAACADDHGDDFASATPVTIGSVTHGQIEVSVDRDFFRFTVATNAKYVMFSRDATGWVPGTLYDVTYNKITDNSAGGEGDNFRIERVLTPGTYYLELGSMYNFAGPYNLHIEGPGLPTTTDDHGFSCWSATEVTMGSVTHGEIWDTSDRDFFRFYVATADTYEIRSRNGGGWTKGTLYDSTYTRIADNTGGGDANNFFITRALTPGAYCIEVTGYYNFTGCYQLLVSASGCLPLDDHQLGNSTLSALSDDPVNTATGNFVHRETDILIPSVGHPLTFSRFYNSQDVHNGLIGMAWTHTYNIRVYAETGTVVAVKWDDGRVDRYRDPVGGLYAPVYPECRDTLRREADQTWTLTRRSLDQYRFDTLGRLASIADRNGNRLDFEYNPQSHLASATAPDGRALTFAYTNGLLASVTDPAGCTVRYAYTDNRLTRVTDVLGGEIVNTYDAGGYLAAITDQRGEKTVENEYDANGRVNRQWDGNGNRTDFAYDTPMPGDTSLTSAAGDVTVHTHTNHVVYSMTYPDGSAIRYTYDQKLNRTSIEDRNGGRVTFAYDARGNVTNTVAPDGGVTVTEYADSRFPDLPTRKTDALGAVTEWAYDARGNLAVERRAIGTALEGERAWTYNAAGQATTFTNEMGYVTRFGYEENAGPRQGVLRWTEDSQGHRTHYDYDILWRRTSVTDARGAGAGDSDYTFQYGYDLGGRLTWAATPLGIATYGFDAVGNRTRVTDPNGNETTYEYDAQSNQRFVREPLGKTTEFRYDALNRKALTIDPNRHGVSNRYDALGNLTAVTRLMDGDGPDLTTAFTHDSHGNVLTATDPSGRAVRYEYDAMHRKVAQSNDWGHVWRWEHDLLGRVTRATDANGATTAYVYDALGRLETVTQQDDQGAPLVTRYTYDLLGNLTQVTDADGRTIHKEYDNLGRFILQRDGNGNEHRYAYDALGNQTNVLDANGNAIRMVYDAESRLSEIRYPDASTVAFTYDAAGNRLTMTDRTGTTRFAYDALNRLVTSTSGFGDVVGYAYDASGNRTGLVYPGDRPVTYAYDAANRLRSITDWEARVTRYSYDEAGRMTGMEYPNTVEQARFYDAAGRLSGLQYSQGSSPFLAYAFTRDPQGNPRRISAQGTLPPTFDLPPDVISAHDDDNRLTESTDGQYFHDANGNMTGRVVNAVSTAFSYDFNDMLIRQQTGGNVVEHLYDGQGWRVARTENGVTNRHILDYGRSMSHVLCEVAPDGSIAASYIHGPMIAARLDAAGVPRYYHTDAIGSVVALTDATGAVTDRYAYTPYGVPAGSEGATPNPFRYVGGLGCMEDADGLVFMRARMYSPSKGRFLTKDAVEIVTRGNGAGFHSYAYAESNPKRFTDPSGYLLAEAAIVALTALIHYDECVGFANLAAAYDEGDVGTFLSAFLAMPFGIGSFFEGVVWVGFLKHEPVKHPHGPGLGDVFLNAGAPIGRLLRAPIDLLEYQRVARGGDEMRCPHLKYADSPYRFTTTQRDLDLQIPRTGAWTVSTPSQEFNASAVLGQRQMSPQWEFSRATSGTTFYSLPAERSSR
jgi:RHS repeat-associated protein